MKQRKENIVKIVVMTMNVTGLTHKEFRAILNEMGVEAHPEPGIYQPRQFRFTTDSQPQIVAIRTASLDDPSWFKLQVDVWTSDAHPWDQMNPKLPKFKKYPISK